MQGSRKGGSCGAGLFIALHLLQRFNTSCKLLHFRRPHTLPVLNTASKRSLFGVGFVAPRVLVAVITAGDNRAHIF